VILRRCAPAARRTQPRLRARALRSTGPRVES